MEFGKLSNVSSVRFNFPPEDPRVGAVLGRKIPQKSPLVYVGAPIWTCPNWIGRIYPEGIAARDYLEAYGRQFNSIELNTTFYRIPDRAQVQVWKNQVPGDFRFVPKLHQSISHFQQLTQAKENLRRFWESLSFFDDHLGICFLQLPPDLDFRSWSILKQLLCEVPHPQQLAIEFRHSSWFFHHTLRPEVSDFLQAREMSAVITDVAGRQDVLHSSLTSQKVVVRFVGNELHPSDFLRIDFWATRITSWIRQGIKEVYFFIHQPTQAEVPDLARDFIEMINKRCELSIRCWSPIEKSNLPETQQMNLF